MLSLVGREPGWTVEELAVELKATPDYVRRLALTLEAAKVVRRRRTVRAGRIHWTLHPWVEA